MTETRFFALQGGLDLVTPAIQTPPGHAAAGQNYEPHPRGYQRIDGYERFDGRPKPSEMSYWILPFTSGSTEVLKDDVVEGGTSGATGRAVVDAVLESGSYGAGDAAGFLVLTQVDGDFEDGEDLEVASAKVSEADGAAQNRGALTDENDATWYQAAIEMARADIEKVPGSGPVRGVWVYGADTYAFRDNAAGDEGVMHKSTPDGWEAQDLGRELAFEDGAGNSVVPLGTGDVIPDIVPDIAGDNDAVNNGAVAKMVDAKACLEFSGSEYVNTHTILAEAGDLFAESDRAWTIELEFRSEGTQTCYLVSKGDDGTATGVLAIYINTDAFLRVRLRGGTTLDVATYAAVTDGGWHRLSLTWDGADALVYFDGGSPSSVSVGTESLADYNVVFGTRSDLSTERFEGQMTNIRVWGRALSASEISDHASERLAGTEPGLAAYWPMSDVEGAFEDGDTITGGTSGATAEIKRLVLESGDWTTFDAAGRLILSEVTGGPFEDGEELTTTTGVATADGTVEAITLPPGGRYDFENYNFFARSDLQRMYGCQGEGRAFEWDGETFVPIATGMDDDRPTRLAVRKNHLFLAFRGGSVQHSSVGAPYQWQVVTGAGEIGIGDEITDMLSWVSGVLTIFARDQVAVLQGDDSENWVLVELSDSSGGAPWTAQMIGAPIYQDSNGLRSLDTTERFGDFLVGTMTRMVEPIFRTKRRAGIDAVGSLRVRNKDQYRLFWSDGTGLTVYFGRKNPEAMPFDLGVAITCSTSGKDADGRELLFIGTDDGSVYELDAGTSFDGNAIDAFLRLPFNHVGTPTQRKRWQKATLEIDGGPNTQLGMTAEFGYADPSQPPGQEQIFDVSGAGGFWSGSLWDDFYWSSTVEGLAESHIDGLGRNVSITVVSSAVYEEPHILHGLILHFSYRGLVR